MGINVPVLDMYGMSESTGAISVATINTWHLGSVGQCLDGAHIKIDNPDENGEGEVRVFVCFFFQWISSKTMKFIYRSVRMVVMCLWVT